LHPPQFGFELRCLLVLLFGTALLFGGLLPVLVALPPQPLHQHL
jgi:hypothetical protein